MSLVLNSSSMFHENLGTFFDPHNHHNFSPPHHHHHHQPFPSVRGSGGDNFLLNGKSPRLISASWETLERLPRMSPPTSESITSHLLSSTSSSSSLVPSQTTGSSGGASAATSSSSYYDYSFFYKVICTPEFLRSAKENYIQPMLDTEFNQIVLPVECGKNCAFMYLTRLCQGSKGPCILFNACYWLTPNEFQSISGRNSAKDWKRSIRHNGKSIKLLINKGILTVHSPLCDCAYGSGIEPFVEKYSASSSPPTISSPTTSLDTRAIQYGRMDSECSHSDGAGTSEDDPDHDENISSSTNSDLCPIDNVKHDEKHDVSISSDDEEKIDVVETTSGSDEDNLLSAESSSHDAPYRSVGLALSAAEIKEEDSSSLSVSNNNSNKSNGEQSNGNSAERNSGNGGGSSSSTPTPHKSKRKPSTKQVHQLKVEQQSPTHLSSTTSSPPMTPPPPPLQAPQQTSSSSQSTEGERGNHNNRNNSNNNHSSNNNGGSGGNSPPQQPIKQMEQMMSASSRNYSEFMRSLAAKYNHQQSNQNDYFPNLSFDTRFLKPSAAAAFLNLSQLPSPVLLDKDKFPLIDMSSTQTLLSMVRSASAAAAAAAAVNNNNNTSNHNNNNNDCFPSKSVGSSGGGQKRPNSPLDLSSRDMPPLKKSKLKASSSPLDLMMQSKPSTAMMMAAAAAAAGQTVGQMGQGLGASAAQICMSSCASGCSEEAQIMINWSVDEVCQFVANIDICKDYVEVFRDHSIDGSALPLLTEEHLMTAMNMRLGPALKFRSTVAKRLGNCVICSHCTHCHNHNNN